MFKIGSRQRFMANTLDQIARPKGSIVSAGAADVVKGYKSRRGFVNATGAEHAQSATLHEPLHTVSAAGTSAGGSGGTSGGSSNFLGSSGARVDRYNPVYDDLSRGTVAEDWIPLDPKLQNRMFRIMFSRGVIEGPVVELISELCWSDFDLTGIRDKEIMDTYMASKEAVKPETQLDFITKEYLVLGRVVLQLILDPTQGIWSDLVIHDTDYLKITPIPRSNFMPKIDLIPSPDLQAWARSTDPRDIESRKGIPQTLIDQFMQSRPIPMDPVVTAYLPRRSFFNDPFGTSFYIRNIPLWGLEKSLINATLTGHRRRSGPITQIAVGSENWEPTPEQIDAHVSAYTAAEEDSVSSTIGTRYDVQFNQIRGSLQEMWKWQDEWSFLQEAKLKMFGVSDALLTGDANIDTTTAPTTFLERLKAHRAYVTETFLMQKFFRGLASVHDFRKRTPAELAHRIRIENPDKELILPTIVFRKSLDTAADQARADLLDKMEEKGLPVNLAETNRALGGGEIMERMRSAIEDLEFRLKMMKFNQLKKKIATLQESVEDSNNLDEEVNSLTEQVRQLSFAQDEDGYAPAALDKKGRERAAELADGRIESSSVPGAIAPGDTRASNSAVHDLSLDRASQNRNPHTLSKVGKAV
jgi:hypothetical protein